jgi:hypothetical protein
LLASVLTACADPQPVTVAHHHRHVSPPMVQPPNWPQDSFDRAQAQTALERGKAALERQDLTAARAATETALARWPVATEAWAQLAQICDQQNDPSCRFYAQFYLAKLVMLDGLPMRAAALGFATVADHEVGEHVDNAVYDQRMLDMATRLWVFCWREDPAHANGPEPLEPSFSEAYPYAPALLLIGIGAGVLSGVKAIANK